MDNKETKNKAEELDDESLEEVTGGVYQRKSGMEIGVTLPQLPKTKQFKDPGMVQVPTTPTDDYRTL